MAPDFDKHSLWRILKIERELSKPIDLDSMLGSVMNVVLDVLNADRCTVFLYDPSNHTLYSRVATSEQDEIRFDAGKGIAGKCAQQREILNIPDCYSDSDFNPAIDRATGYRTRCLLAIPLINYDQELVGVLQVLNKIHGVFDDQDTQLADVLASQCAIAIQRAQLMEEALIKQRMQRDLDLARNLQQRVFPQAMPSVQGYDIAGWALSAEETGGDIYDAVSIDEHKTMLLLGDATGHGLGPAVSVTQCRAMFRMAVRLQADLDNLVSHINDQLTEDLPLDRFITAFIGCLDAQTHTIQYAAAGQAPLIHYHHAERQCELINASSIPLGMMSDIPIERPAPIQMKPGDVFGLLTDGFFEYFDARGEEFGSERVCDFFGQNHTRPMDQFISGLRETVDAFAEGAPQLDDMTAIVLRRLH